MKFAAVCAIIVALALVQVSSAQNNNEWGERVNGDTQLLREIVVKKYSFLQIVSKDISVNGVSRITYIKTTDQYTDGNGGYASLKSGGTGNREVTIHLQSQRSHGLNFIVEVYGF